MMKNNKYYQIQDDVAAYPDATIYIVWSRRGVGKTYSALKYPYEQGFKTVYMKRNLILRRLLRSIVTWV